MRPVEEHRDEALDLQSAADALGVHYQTAYKWIRTGQLPAQLVAGKYRVHRRAVDAFLASRQSPEPPRPPTRRRLDRQAELVHEALLDGDETTVRRIARQLTEEGSSLVQVIEETIAPSLARIGQGWHDGQLTIWVEHRASAIVERVLGELAPNPRGRRRGTVVVAAVSGDRHSLPTTMAAVALREANWRVHHLGADMPPEEIASFCRAHEVDLAVISMTSSAVARTAAEAVQLLTSEGVPTLLGAPGRTLGDLVEQARHVVAA